jgi:hypothetical protein
MNRFVKDRSFRQIEMAHNGAFGFEATLTFTVDAQNAGRYANLYYYNETSKELEFVESSEIDKEGNTNLLFSHASSYVITIDSESMEQKIDTASSEKIEEDSNTDATENNPIQSGSSNYMWIYLILGFIAVSAIVSGVVYAQKKNNKEECE